MIASYAYGIALLVLALGAVAALVTWPLPYVTITTLVVCFLMLEWWRATNERRAQDREKVANAAAAEAQRTVVITDRDGHMVLYASIAELRLVNRLGSSDGGCLCLMCRLPLPDDSTVAIIAEGVLAHPVCLHGLRVEVKP